MLSRRHGHAVKLRLELGVGEILEDTIDGRQFAVPIFGLLRGLHFLQRRYFFLALRMWACALGSRLLREQREGRERHGRDRY